MVWPGQALGRRMRLLGETSAALCGLLARPVVELRPAVGNASRAMSTGACGRFLPLRGGVKGTRRPS